MPNTGPISLSNEAMLQYLQTHVRRDGECLLWAGALIHGRYPSVGWRWKKWQAQRLLLKLLRRRVPKRHVVYAICGTPTCMNADHLRHAPRAQSLKETPNNICRGARRSLIGALVQARKGARLSIHDRAEVIRMRSEGCTLQQVGDRYGVSKTAVGHALRAWARATGREA